MKLLIAEKPDVMRKLVGALDPKARRVSYSQRVSYYEGRYIFASALGHLFEAKTPDEISEKNKRWSAGRLQDIPDVLPLKANSSDRNYFKCIKELCSRNDIDEIIVCTDADREGQVIWTLIASMMNIRCTNITRIWIKEWTNKGLNDAFSKRQPNISYSSLAEAGVARMWADYMIGLTGTRVITSCFGGSHNVLNTGRVQSPTGYLVYAREREIAEFKPEPYDIVSIETTSDDSTRLTLASDKVDDKKSMEIVKAIIGKSLPLAVASNRAERRSPALYNTNTLLIDANKRYGFTAEKTTAILQTLYQDKGLTTYPRTEIDRISVSSANDAHIIISKLCSLPNDGATDMLVQAIDYIRNGNIAIQKHVVDTAGKQDMPHEAITPTFDGNPGREYETLTADEKKIYLMVVARYLQAFFSPAIIEETVITTEFDDVKFRASGKTIIDASWMQLTKVPDDTLLPHVTDGKSYSCQQATRSHKQTTPPARFTEATLLDAMQNAYRYVTDAHAKAILKETKGIGTSATREEVLSKMYHSHYFELKGKSIVPTEKLNGVMEILSVSPIVSPLMTSMIETDLQRIEDGSLAVSDFRQTIYDYIDEIIKNAIKIKNESPDAGISAGYASVGVCPVCGSPVENRGKVYKCISCDFHIFSSVAGKKLSTAAVKQLLSKGETSSIDGFTSRAGKKFSARLKLNEQHNVEFDFSAKSVGECSCGGALEDKGYGIRCAKCGKVVYSNALEKLGKKKVSSSEAVKLLNGETIPVKLISKAGNSYKAKAYYDTATKRINIIFK